MAVLLFTFPFISRVIGEPKTGAVTKFDAIELLL